MDVLHALNTAEYVLVWRDREGCLGHKGWWEVRLAKEDERRYYAYEATLEDAVRRAKELADGRGA